MRKVAVFTVIFPGNLKFFGDFMCSLQRQTHKQFHLMLVVDGVPDIADYLKPFLDDLVVETKFYSGTIAEVRDFGVRWILMSNYDYIIFADSDDIMHEHRVAACLRGLESAPVVVNDVVPFHSFADVDGDGYWRERLQDGQVFGAETIEFCNFAGLGNSAVRKDVLTAFNIPSRVIAVDWFLFYRWLQSRQGMFMHEGVIYYRQHTSNTAGLAIVTPEKLFRVLQTKLRHMDALVCDFPNFKYELQRHQRLSERLAVDSIFLNEVIQRFSGLNLNFFWWEETQFIHE